MIHDVIVVGSGPGGAVAAATLAAGGKSVLLADRQTFPRDKVCGDGLPVEVMKMLKETGVDIDAAGLQYQRLDYLSITGPGGQTISVTEKLRDVFSMTAPRYSFDNMLHEHAVKTGAHFEVMHIHKPLMSADGQRVVGVVERRNGQMIEHEAQVVIAAGGVSSPIARALSGRSKSDPEATAVGIRAYACLKRPADSAVRFFFQKHLLPGYAWIFSVGPQRVNIGIYIHNATYQDGAKDLPALLDQFCAWLREAEGYDFELEPDTIKTWPLPIYINHDSRSLPGVFLVGDEGHFTNALTGGGIYSAMLTGRLAAQQALKLLDGQSAAYDASWYNVPGADLRRGRLVQKYIATQPPLFNGLIKVGSHPLLRYRIMKAIAGDHY